MAVAWPALNPGPGGRVVVVVVGGVDVVVVVALGWFVAAKWCAGVDVAEVSSTRNAVTAPATATMAIVAATILPDGRRPLFPAVASGSIP